MHLESLRPARQGDRRRQDLVSHAGAALLAELAARRWLTEVMSLAMAEYGIRYSVPDVGCAFRYGKHGLAAWAC